jgi:hypothetical protein
MARALVAAALLGAVCSCSHPAFRPLDADALRRYSPLRVAAPATTTPPFQTSAGGQMVMMSPLISDLVNAKTRASVSGLESFDPANLGRPFILAGMAQRFPVQDADARGSDLIIDLRTVRWGLTANRDDRFWLEYVGTLRVLDARSGAVLAEGTCATPEPRSDADQPPSVLAWGLNGSALLKQELWNIANRCADDYLARVLRVR